MPHAPSIFVTAGRSFGKVLRTVKAALHLTDYPRWERNAKELRTWDARTKVLGHHILPGSRVLDLGAGAQTLRRHLTGGGLYVPCVLVATSPDTIVVDFNRGLYPTSERKSVFAVCSGLIEYINEPSVFLKRFQSYASNILISYNPSAGGNRELVIRFGREWISHFSPEQSEQFFGENNLRFGKGDQWD
jgi:hypothetical protein